MSLRIILYVPEINDESENINGFMLEIIILS